MRPRPGQSTSQSLKPGRQLSTAAERACPRERISQTNKRPTLKVSRQFLTGNQRQASSILLHQHRPDVHQRHDSVRSVVLGAIIRSDLYASLHLGVCRHRLRSRQLSSGHHILFASFPKSDHSPDYRLHFVVRLCGKLSERSRGAVLPWLSRMPYPSIADCSGQLGVYPVDNVFGSLPLPVLGAWSCGVC